MNTKTLGGAVGALLIVFGVAAFITPKYYFAGSEATCDSWYPFNVIEGIKNRDDVAFSKNYNQILDDNIKCKQLVRDGKTLLTFFRAGKSIKDAGCEAESFDIKKVCYMKKAIDENEPRYCENLISRDFCLYELAVIKKDASICDLVHAPYDKTCSPKVETCKQNSTSSTCGLTAEFLCPPFYKDDYEFKRKQSQDCVLKYGKEYEGAPLEL